MKNKLRLLAILPILICVVAAFVQSKNPEELLKAINEARAKRISDARSAGQQVDLNAVNAEVLKMANDAISGIDVAKVEPAQAYSWAQIFSLAGKHEEVCNLCHKYLTTNPSPEPKFSAQTLMMTSCAARGEGKMLADTLPGVIPPNFSASQQLLSRVANSYAGVILEDLGVDAAIKAIDGAIGLLQFESPEEYAKRLFESTKARKPKNPDGTEQTDAQISERLISNGKQVNESVLFSGANKKFSLLKDAGRTEEAKKILEEFIAKADPAGSTVRRAKSALVQMTIVGSPAPQLQFGRMLGEFKGLDQWKGKVVIVDFTAHW